VIRIRFKITERPGEPLFFDIRGCPGRSVIFDLGDPGARAAKAMSCGFESFSTRVRDECLNINVIRPRPRQES
jgi:hypothetical protein